MISRLANSRIQSRTLSRLLAASQRVYFSESSSDPKLQAILDLLEESKQEKDQKYEELALKFEREWKKLYEEPNPKQLQQLEADLSEKQKKRVELISKEILGLNMFEYRFFGVALRNHVYKATGITPSKKLNLNWDTLKKTDIGTWPAANPNWLIQQEAIAKLWPLGEKGFAELLGSMGGGSAGAAGAGADTAASQAQAEQAKEAAKPVEEKPAEKAKFDIELVGFDATKKISIIKEVRELLKLGLKEAKEMVEKAPVVLKKDVKKEEAEPLKEKLIAIGCNINLL